MNSTDTLYKFDVSLGLKQRLSEAVLDRLTRLMLERSLRPGDALPSESDLARSFGVSKPVIREALQQLATMGVIEIRQGRPSTVSKLTSKPLEMYLRLAVRSMPYGLREALELRRGLETQTAMMAASRISADQIKRLRETLLAMETSKNLSDEWVDVDLEFHRLIAEASGNVLMLMMVEALRGTMEDTIRALQAQRHVRNADATVQRHRDIVDALEAGDPEAARRAMQTHFDATEPVALHILGQDGEMERAL